MMSHEIDAILEDYDDLLVLEPRDRFDPCIVGVVERFTSTFVVYSKRCVLAALARDMDGDPDDADERYGFNTLGAWVGDSTPGFLIDNRLE